MPADINVQDRLDAEVTRVVKGIANDLRALADQVEREAGFKRRPGSANAVFVAQRVISAIPNGLANMHLSLLISLAHDADRWAAVEEDDS